MEFILLIFLFSFIGGFIYQSILDYLDRTRRADFARRSLDKVRTETRKRALNQRTPNLETPKYEHSQSYQLSIPDLDSMPIIITDKQQYLSSDEWNSKRKQRLALDNYTCQRCGIDQVPLEVHHLHYRTYKRESMSDLISLCAGPNGCHAKLHKKSMEMHPEQPFSYDYDFPLSLLD
jgi:5-methylcytosine-specific restriction endonuclease McrA